MTYRCVFKGPYHSTCRALKSWLPTAGCWIIEEIVCDTLKFAYTSSKHTDLSSIQYSLTQNPKSLTDNRNDSRKSRILIYDINPLLEHVPLHTFQLWVTSFWFSYFSDLHLDNNKTHSWNISEDKVKWVQSFFSSSFSSLMDMITWKLANAVAL